ncbi:MAG: ROK family protein [Ruminococcaceae bacterium]|nr:ROK family protein [Oscillospiraceae bacterium]
MYRIGIDLGGTNIAAGLVDENGAIVDRAAVKTNLPTDPDRIVRNMAHLTRTLMERNGLRNGQIHSVGVGVPCTADLQNGWMRDADHLGFSSAPLKAPLEKALGLPVRMANDADAAALGEFRGGGYEGTSFVLVTLGTGIGGGIILNGQLYTGINNAAGELGHMTIHMDGQPCGCGRKGCFEAYGSATALIRQACAATRDTVTEAKTVFDRAAAGEQAYISVLDRYTAYLAEGFANIINIFGPDYLCIGGGVSAAGDALLEPVRAKTFDRVFAKKAGSNTRIVLARLGNDAGILGAALL